MRKMIALILILFTTSVFSMEREFTEEKVPDKVRDCFALGMIGYDSVINSSLKLPQEHMVQIVAQKVGDKFSADAIKYISVVAEAYIFEHQKDFADPHDFSLLVNYYCLMGAYDDLTELP